VIIDAHIHVGRWDHADFLGREVTLANTIEVLREAGCGGAALCPTDQCKNSQLLADAKAEMAGGYDGKLWVFPWVRPGAQADVDVAFLRANRDSICGMKIHPSLSRLRITDEAYAPMLEIAHRHSMVVLVHCGRWQEIASYRFAIEAAKRYPQAKFLLAHAGGDTPPLATAAAEMVAEECVDNVWFEFSGVREYWVIERNCLLLGAERYLLGSDYGLAHPLMYIGAVQGMNVSASDKERILAGNALELFGDPVTADGGAS